MINKPENRINEILSSFDGIKRAEARPFMFTRIMAIFQNDDTTILSKTVSFIARPLVALACFAIVIAANVYFIANNERLENESVAGNGNTNSVSEEVWQNDNLLLTVNYLETGE